MFLFRCAHPHMRNPYRRARDEFGLRPIRLHGSDCYLLNQVIAVGRAMDIEAEA